MTKNKHVKLKAWKALIDLDTNCLLFTLDKKSR